MGDLISKLARIFDRRERRRLVWILCNMLVMAVVSTIGVASILPFITLLANPQAVYENRWLAAAYDLFGFATPTQFLFATGIVTLAVLVLSNTLRALTDWTIMRFTRDLQHRLSRRMLDQYLNESYEFFLNRNTSKLAKVILSEVNKVVTGVLVPVMRGTAQLVVALFIIVMLISVDPRLAAFLSLGLGSVYGLIYLAIRRQQARLGTEWITANTLRFKVANEAFGGVKDVKALGRERHFLDRFEQPSRRYARAQAQNELISSLPKYAVEVVAFGGMLVIVLYLLGTGHALDRALPILSLYAFAAYRLMPSLQELFQNVAKIRFHAAALDELIQDMDRKRARVPVVSATTAPPEGPPLHFADEVRLEKVTYRYPGAPGPALREVDLVLPHNGTIGLVGKTGSGKSTLVDLLLGLYRPSSGLISVDGVPLEESRLSEWRRHVGYVPQQIFLADDAVVNNIAFGLPREEIDRAAVERAATIAHIDDFIRSLPEGYETVVGERGVRLSGGQRQRIGIARALYHDPDLLFLDEATSALDTLTEDAVMEAIQRLAGTKTMVIIAHRLSTVAACDVIYLLDHGRIVATGTYEELQRTHPQFRAMSGQAAVAPAR